MSKLLKRHAVGLPEITTSREENLTKHGGLKSKK